MGTKGKQRLMTASSHMLPRMLSHRAHAATNDKDLCSLFKVLAFCNGQTDNYRWKLGDGFALRAATQRRARDPNPAHVFLSLQLQLEGMPWQKHKSRSSPEQSDTSLPASQQLYLLLHCTPKLEKKAMPFPPYLSGCSHWLDLFLCHLF